MRASSFSFSSVCQVSLRSICCFALMSGSLPSTANEPFLDKPSAAWTEEEALQVLNDSPWAKTITATSQDIQCDYEHPAYPGTFSAEFARYEDSLSLAPPATNVKADGAQYLVRLVSVKPMQAAAARLVALTEEKWKHYQPETGKEEGEPPTSVADHFYNQMDEITIVVVLKHPGPDGSSFHDYAFPSGGLHHLWPCAAVRTTAGTTTAVLGGPGSRLSGLPEDGIGLSFPSTVNGKPLINHPNEKLEFRFVVNQHVFEATFNVNASDLFGGTESVLSIPKTFDELTPAPRP